MNSMDHNRGNIVLSSELIGWGARPLHLVSVICVCASLILASLPCSVWLRLGHTQLQAQLNASQMALLQRLSETKQITGSAEAFAVLNQDSGVRRVKRDDRRKTPLRSSRRRHHRNEGRENKLSGFHMVIDRELSEPQNPQLKTKNRGDVINYWKVAEGQHNAKQKFATLQPDGLVTIKQSGLYFIYSQITYYDRSGSWSHTVDVDHVSRFKCIAREWGVSTDPDTQQFYNTVHQCLTGGAVYIHEDRKVSIKGMYPNRTLHADPEVTYWGIFKLS